MTKKCIIILLAVICGLAAQGQHVYRISCEDFADSLKVSLSCRFDSRNAEADYLLLSEVCNIASSNLGEYGRVGDTLRFRHPIAELQMVYSIPKAPFTTADGAVVLRREGNWYPHRNSELLTAVLTLDDTLDYVLCGRRLTERDMAVDTAFEMHLIMLPKDRYAETVKTDACRPFCFYRSIADTARREGPFYAEFVAAYDFFSSFFGDTLSRDPMHVVEISDPQFVMCQSLPGTIIFGSYFYEIYTMLPDCSWIPHEMAHQWWGNSLFFEHRDYALSESVNEYLKLLFLSHRRRGFDDQLAVYEGNMSVATEHPSIASIRDVQDMNAAIAIYSEAPLRLWNAVSSCRDCRFSESLVAIYKQYRHTIIHRRQFAARLNKAMQPLFMDWMN